VPVPTYRDSPSTPAADLSGVNLDGRPVRVPVLGTGRWTIVLFLSTGCHGCLQVWDGLADPAVWGLAGDELVVAVTRGPDHEDVEVLRNLAPSGVPVVMSDSAWGAYRVQGPPFFALIDGRSGTGRLDGDQVRVAAEGVVWGVSQIVDDIRRTRDRA